MREIAPLSTLVLRYVGPSTCNPELTFGGPTEPPAKDESKPKNKESKDSSETSKDEETDDTPIKCPPPPQNPTATSRLLRSLRDMKRPRRPYKGAARPNANDVDLSHPWILAHESPSPNKEEVLCIEHGNHAIDCLQLFIDALVDSGRAGDTRLGVHSFREWVVAVIGQEEANKIFFIDDDGKKAKKRRKLITESRLPLGSLSLHNFSAASYNTFRSMEMASVGVCLGVLDLTGVHGLTDEIVTEVLCAGSFPHIQRLSIKNCRKITGEGLASLVNLTKLTALDLGGCFNIRPNDVLSMVQDHPGTEKGTFTELYASGLGWTDVDLELLIDATSGHLRGLGVGFSPYVSGPGLMLTISKVAETLERLAVPFCDGMDDATASALGKNLTKLEVLDIRGTKVTSLTGLMDGRIVSGVVAPLDDVAEDEIPRGRALKGHLFVLARYSGISKNSLEETLKLHQNAFYLTCVLDGTGTGCGIRR